MATGNGDWYDDIIEFVAKGHYPSKCITNTHKTRFRRYCAPYCVEDKRLLYNHAKYGKVPVVRIKRDRQVIVRRCHFKNHTGIAETLDLLSRQYYWPGIGNYVRKVVSRCPLCTKSHGLPKVLDIASSDPLVVGKFDSLPAPQANVIRVFISSTFTDMTVERNVLMRSTFPQLQDYFRSKGFDFQVVDMRWGVREEMVLDHQATALCLQEIINSRNVSRGVCFLALLGDKYGSCPLPAAISTREFKIFESVLSKAKKKNNPLSEWYILDDNAIPSQYILRPLSDKYPFYNSTVPDHLEQRLQERNHWQQAQLELQQTLHRAALLAFESGHLSNTEKHNYFMAVTEKEISAGILNNSEANSQTLCFIRDFTHFNESDALAPRYADIVDQKVDAKSKLLLQQLKDIKLPKCLTSESLRRYQVEWTANGIDEANPVHKAYLDQLCKDIFAKIVAKTEARIDKNEATASATIRSIGDDAGLFDELLHQARQCANKGSAFVQRRKLEAACQRALKLRFPMEKVSDALGEENIVDLDSNQEPHMDDEITQMDDEIAHDKENFLDNDINDDTDISTQIEDDDELMCNRPIIITGSSGHGKTYLMARLAKKFCSGDNDWLSCHSNDAIPSKWMEQTDTVKVVRFLGTSPKSCGIRDVLTSTLKQLWLAFGVWPADANQVLSNQFAHLADYFRGFLWSLDSFSGKILICFDAIDQLSADDAAYTMNWLPTELPRNCYMFISMLSDSTPCLENAQRVLREPSCFIFVGTLGNDTARHILNHLLSEAGRRLTGRQETVIMDALHHSNQPLFLKLAVEQAKEWKSFTDVSQVKLGKNNKEWIKQLFISLRQQHGCASEGLHYITASRNGLSEQEITDLLSLNNHVLEDTYIYHLPPEPTLIRLPPILWHRIRHQLKDYLVEKQADHQTVLGWHHRQFWETAEANLNPIATEVHDLMASYFSGAWHAKPKPLTLRKGKNAEYPNAYRNAPPMPNEFAPNIPNLRKLSELPYHSILSFNINLSADVLCNFDFVLCKLRFLGLRELLADFKLYFQQFESGRERYAELVYVKLGRESVLTTQSIEVRIVYDLLLISGDTISADWTELAAHIVARLSSDWLQYPRVQQMVSDARAWMEKSCQRLLVPNYPCFQTPGGLLRTSINHRVYIPGRYADYSNILHISNGQLYVREMQWNNSDVLNVYNLESGELMQTMRLKLNVDEAIFVRKEKFLVLKVRRRNRQDYTNALFNIELQQRVKIQPQVNLIRVATSEQFLLITCENEFAIYDFSETNELTKRTNSIPVDDSCDIVEAQLSLDDTLAFFLTADGLFHAFCIHQEKFIVQMHGNKIVQGVAESSHLTLKMLVTTNNDVLFRGLCETSSRTLYALRVSAEGCDERCLATDWSVDTLVLHKTHQWVAVATKARGTKPGVKNRTRPLYIWDFINGTIVHSIAGNKGAYFTVVFLGAEHQYLAFSREFDPGIIITAVGTPQKPHHSTCQLLKLGGHTQPVCSLVVSVDETVLVTCSQDNTIKMWDLSTTMDLCHLMLENVAKQKPRRKDEQTKDITAEGEETRAIAQFSGNLSTAISRKDMGGCHAAEIVLSKNKQYAVTGCMFGRLAFFNLHTGDYKVVQGHLHYSKKVRQLLFSDDEEFLFSIANEPHILVWRTSTGELIHKFKLDDFLNSATVCGNKLYAGHCGTDGSKSYCQLWTWSANGSQIEVISKDTVLVDGPCFIVMAVTSDNSHIVSWNGEHPVVVRRTNDTPDVYLLADTSQGAWHEIQSDERSYHGRIKITGDDRYALIASSNPGRWLHIVDLQPQTSSSPALLHVLNAHTSISCLTLCADNIHAVIGRFKIIDYLCIVTGTILSSLDVHNEYIERFQFCCEQRLAVSISQDKTLKVWHVYNGDNELRLEIVSRLTFHCPIRLMAAPSDLSFVLVGPETAAPLAVVTPNPTLAKTIANVGFTELHASTRLETDNSIHHASAEPQAYTTTESQRSIDYTLSSSNGELHLVLSASHVRLYADGTLTKSVTRENFLQAASIASIFGAAPTRFAELAKA